MITFDGDSTCEQTFTYANFVIVIDFSLKFPSFISAHNVMQINSSIRGNVFSKWRFKCYDSMYSRMAVTFKFGAYIRQENMRFHVQSKWNVFIFKLRFTFGKCNDSLIK